MVSDIKNPARVWFRTDCLKDMTRDFTPSQVMKGEVEYGFDDFWRDLFEEVKTNFGDVLSTDKLERALDLNWIFCHLKATEPSDEAILTKLSGWGLPTNKEFLDIMGELNKENWEMLTAIYQNLFLKFYEMALLNSWGDDEKAKSEATILLDLYIKKHVRNKGGTPQA